MSENESAIITEEFILTKISPVEATVNELVKRYDGVVYDVSTSKGMATARADRAALRTARVNLELARKEEKASVLKLGKFIDSEAARIGDVIAKYEVPLADQIKAEEDRVEAEKERKREEARLRLQKITEAIEKIKLIPVRCAAMTSEQLTEQIAFVEAIQIGEDFYGEFRPSATDAKTAAYQELVDLKNVALQLEQETAERLQREKEEREEQERLQEEERQRLAEQQKELDRQREEFAEQQRQQEEANRLQRETFEREQAEANKQARIREDQERQEREAEEKRLKEIRDEEDRKNREAVEAAEKKLKEERDAQEAELQRQRDELKKQQDEAERVQKEAEDKKREEERLAAIEADRKAKEAEKDRKAAEKAKKLALAKLSDSTAALKKILSICEDHEQTDRYRIEQIAVIAEANI